VIGVDTTVLLRLLIVDDIQQNARAKAFFAQRTPEDPAYIGAIVLTETVWVLRRQLKYSRQAVENVVNGLLASAELVIEDGQRLEQLLSQTPSLKTDIADFFVAWGAERAGCLNTVTFDVKAAKAVPSMQLLA
jgi:predicted nucleic-acid-binding protein